MPRIAIIGCGLIGETHARALSALGAPPVLFCDSAIERASELAGEFGGRAMSDAERAVTDPGVDAVFICTYHDTHARLATLAAKAGKAIFLEKPMAITKADCDAIAQAVANAAVLCMSGFKLHYYSLASKAKELIGRPIALTAQVIDLRWPDGHWANDPITGGGNVLSQGCHAVELLSYLAAAKPMRIYAEGGNLHHPSLDIIDTMAATISYDSGAVATLFVGDVGEAPHDGKFSFQAMDGEKSVHLYERLTSLSYFDGEREHLYRGDEDGFLNEDREFLAALAAGRQPETNEQDGARATYILLAGIESIRTHQPQSLEHLL